MVEASKAKSSVSLVIPCKPEYVALGRLVAGSLGSGQGWSEEAIADLKVVVSETASLFVASDDTVTTAAEGITAASAFAPLSLDLDVGPDRWVLTASRTGAVLEFAPESGLGLADERALGLTIVQALADTWEKTDDPGHGTVLRVSKRLTDRASAED